MSFISKVNISKWINEEVWTSVEPHILKPLKPFDFAIIFDVLLWQEVDLNKFGNDKFPVQNFAVFWNHLLEYFSLQLHLNVNLLAFYFLRFIYF